jgi:hypothetical protein
LTLSLDSISQLKYEHYETVAQHTRNVWRKALDWSTVGTRAQVDVWEKISERGVQNDGLGRMIASCVDPVEGVPAGVVERLERVERVQFAVFS